MSETESNSLSAINVVRDSVESERMRSGEARWGPLMSRSMRERPIILGICCARRWRSHNRDRTRHLRR
jgi:hypothetical protein